MLHEVTRPFDFTFPASSLTIYCLCALCTVVSWDCSRWSRDTCVTWQCRMLPQKGTEKCILRLYFPENNKCESPADWCSGITSDLYPVDVEPRSVHPSWVLRFPQSFQTVSGIVPKNWPWYFPWDFSPGVKTIRTWSPPLPFRDGVQNLWSEAFMSHTHLGRINWTPVFKSYKANGETLIMWIFNSLDWEADSLLDGQEITGVWTRGLIFVLARSRRWTLSWATTSSSPVLIFPSDLHLGSPSDVFSLYLISDQCLGDNELFK
jgi:hypothetical protein